MSKKISQSSSSLSTSSNSKTNSLDHFRKLLKLDEIEEERMKQLPEEPVQDLSQKEIFFPKSQYEYDRSLEPIATFTGGFSSKMRDLLASKKLKEEDVIVEETTKEKEFIALPATVTSKKMNEDDSVNKTRFKNKWTVPNARFVSSARLQLHNEIVAYRDHVQPSKEDLNAREEVVSVIRKVATDLYPDSRTEVFGSVRTGLCLPDSDVDICIFDTEDRRAIFKISTEIKKRRLVEHLETIDKARVPIVKLRLINSPFTSDISFDQPGGIKTAYFIQQVMESLPELKCLVLVVKHFLLQRDLNETYRGGMGSYLCFLTCLSVVQRARRLNKNRPENLGTLLSGGSYFKKQDRDWINEERPMLLCLEDPVTPDNDIGRNCWQIGIVKRAFCLAHKQLLLKLESFDRINFGVKNESILSAVIRVDDREISSSTNVTEFSSSDEEESE